MKKKLQKYSWIGLAIGLLIALFPMAFAAIRFGAVPASEVTPDMIPYFIVSGVGLIVVVISIAVSEKQGPRR